MWHPHQCPSCGKPFRCYADIPCQRRYAAFCGPCRRERAYYRLLSTVDPSLTFRQ